MGSIYKASPNVGLQLGFPHYCKKLIARDSSKWHPVFSSKVSAELLDELKIEKVLGGSVTKTEDVS